VIPLAALICLLGSPLKGQVPQAPASSSAPAATSPPSDARQASALPRGKKLFLKDGSFQLVREYQVEADRIRYYSLDSQQWEEMPLSMVDWDATKKEAAKEQQQEAALIKKAEKEQMEQNAEPLDIDASIEVSPDVFLPDGQGLFAFDGKSVQRMNQAPTEGSLNKEKVIEQIMIPIPIVPTRHNIFMTGAHAKFRLKTEEPEFYLRTTEPDQPELDLVRTKVEKDKRQIENLDEMYGQRQEIRNSVRIHILQMAEGVYRVSVEQNLKPGEYAVLEVLRGASGQAAEERGELNLYVWDFGLDALTSSRPSDK
jgi:hypothetical protein